MGTLELSLEKTYGGSPSFYPEETPANPPAPAKIVASPAQDAAPSFSAAAAWLRLFFRPETASSLLGSSGLFVSCHAGPIGAPRGQTHAPQATSSEAFSWEDPKGFLIPTRTPPQANTRFYSDGQKKFEATLREENWFEVLGHEILLPSASSVKWLNTGMLQDIKIGAPGTLWRDLWLPAGTTIRFPEPGFDDELDAATIVLPKESTVRGHRFPAESLIQIPRNRNVSPTLSIWPSRRLEVDGIPCAAQQKLLLDKNGELIGAILSQDFPVNFGDFKAPAKSGTWFHRPTLAADSPLSPSFYASADAEILLNGQTLSLKKGEVVRFWDVETDHDPVLHVKSFTLAKAKSYPHWGTLPAGTQVFFTPEGDLRFVTFREATPLKGKQVEPGTYFMGEDHVVVKRSISRDFD